MSKNYQKEGKKTFRAILLLYFMISFYGGILPVNIDNLLTTLPKTTKFGMQGI